LAIGINYDQITLEKDCKMTLLFFFSPFTLFEIFYRNKLSGITHFKKIAEESFAKRTKNAKVSSFKVLILKGERSRNRKIVKFRDLNLKNCPLRSYIIESTVSLIFFIPFPNLKFIQHLRVMYIKIFKRCLKDKQSI